MNERIYSAAGSLDPGPHCLHGRAGDSGRITGGVAGEAESRTGGESSAARSRGSKRGNVSPGRGCEETGCGGDRWPWPARGSPIWPPDGAAPTTWPLLPPTFIINWEAEHYRSALLGTATESLAGKVAVVTGAASGLGCGIAKGLVEAGAAVAFCDVDEAGAKAAAAASAAPSRAFPVHMDVTDEGAVAAAFDQVLRHWGGVDIAVCAAGIAPAYELVDTPVNLWRLALEINLTGYFLVAREAARIMRAQARRRGDDHAVVQERSRCLQCQLRL